MTILVSTKKLFPVIGIYCFAGFIDCFGHFICFIWGNDAYKIIYVSHFLSFTALFVKPLQHRFQLYQCCFFIDLQNCFYQVYFSCFRPHNAVFFANKFTPSFQYLHYLFYQRCPVWGYFYMPRVTDYVAAAKLTRTSWEANYIISDRL